MQISDNQYIVQNCNYTKVHAVHLLNDFSGSPLVFAEALKKMQANGVNVALYTATPSGSGFLSALKDVELRPIFYHWTPNKYITLVYFFLAQFIIFLKLLVNVKRNELVYVNTLLPFGALVAAKCKGAYAIQHVHEVSLKPLRFKKMMVWFSEYFADELIFVSNYVKGHYAFNRPKSRVVFNTLPEEFIERAKQSLTNNHTQKETILMLCSLKAYKGIHEFIQIASLLPNQRFELVLNASEAEVKAWREENSIPQNCIIFSTQSDTHSFYHRAKVVMNLSRQDEWIETFGMTILEAMAYECFVITPVVGGPLELLEYYPNGMAIDGRNLTKITEVLQAQFEESVAMAS